MNNIYVALVTVLLTIGLIMLLQPLAWKIGLLDKPNVRKKHSGSIPLVGGIAIFLAMLLATHFGMWLKGVDNVLQSGAGAFMFAAFILVAVGVWDDLRDLSPAARLVVQIAAAFVMIYGGDVVITDLGYLGWSGQRLDLGAWSVPFTVFVTVGVINAINMADGLDGLVGNLALVSLVGLGWAMTLWGGVKVAPMINVLSAAVIGFLLFNQRVFWRSRAAVFLGDAGSMMLGLALVWATISLSQGEARAITPAAALWFLMVPVCDTVSVSLRRIRAGRSPFTADSRHLHHLFMQVGFSVTQTITILCGLALLGVAVGLGSVWLQWPEWLVVGLFLFVWVVCSHVSASAWDQRHFLGRDFVEDHPVTV